MAEQIKPEPEPQLVACTFDPSDVPSKKEEETPKLVKCTFDAPKQNEETEKPSEDEKCPKEDKTPPSDPSRASHESGTAIPFATWTVSPFLLHYRGCQTLFKLIIYVYYIYINRRAKLAL